MIPLGAGLAGLLLLCTFGVGARADAADHIGPKSADAFDTFPAGARVTGVQAGNVVNIRQFPDIAAPVLGQIPADSLHVEILALSEDGLWAQVPMPEGIGWVFRRYLTLERGSDVPPGQIPHPLKCYGTEPFWSLSFEAGGAIGYMTPDMDPGQSPIRLTAQTPPAQEDGAPPIAAWRSRLADGVGRVFDLEITRKSCSDGMSDRVFGLGAVLRGPDPHDPQSEERRFGCCTLDHRAAFGQ